MLIQNQVLVKPNIFSFLCGRVVKNHEKPFSLSNLCVRQKHSPDSFHLPSQNNVVLVNRWKVHKILSTTRQAFPPAFRLTCNSYFHTSKLNQSAETTCGATSVDRMKYSF
jgi:hypothetical protein